MSLLLILVGCSKLPRKPESLFSLKVTVEHLSYKDAWKVTFQTSQPVPNLIFDRQANRFKVNTWKPLTSGIVVKEINGKEQLVSLNSKPFQEASFEFASYYEMTPKDYEFFQSFSDSSVVMYTGHLHACPETEDCHEPVEFLFIPRSHEEGIVEGKVFRSSIMWRDKTRRGTYVYFGNLNPIETTSLTAIVDPALPKWLKDRFNSLLPNLFDYYAKKTGYALSFKPFVFLSYSSEGGGKNSSGGTLPGLIQLSLLGKSWAEEDEESFIDLTRFLAHETAHLWNGQLFQYKSGDIWMHEGGADAFSYLALYDLKYISKQRLLDFQTEAFNACLSMLKNRPLMEVNEDPNRRAHYRCGAIFSLLTHAALVRKTGNDLFYFWNQLFKRVQKEGKLYTEDLYFTTLEEIIDNKQLSEKIKILSHGPLLNAQEIFMSQFHEWGVVVKESTSRHITITDMPLARLN